MSTLVEVVGQTGATVLHNAPGWCDYVPVRLDDPIIGTKDSWLSLSHFSSFTPVPGDRIAVVAVRYTDSGQVFLRVLGLELP